MLPRALTVSCALIPMMASALASMPGEVYAAGIEYPDNGTVAIGRGGAHAAYPDDGMAFQYNPAGLAQQRGWHLLVDSRLAMQAVRFEPAPFACEVKDGKKACSQADAIENDAPPFLAPSFALSWGTGPVGPLSSLTLAIAATGPSSIGRLSYPKTGAERYALDQTDYLIAFYSAAVAGGIGDWLRFGVTGQLAHGKARFTQAVWSGFGKQTELKDTSFDSTAEFDGESGLLPTGILGVTWLPGGGFAVGASYRPGLTFDAPGELTVTPPKFALDQGIGVANETRADGSRVYAENARLLLNFADLVRLGVRHQTTPRLSWEVDATWERWSVLQQIEIRVQGLSVTYQSNGPQKVPVADIVFQKHFEDAVSLRAGADYTLLPDRLTVRGGYTMETSAIPERFASVDFPNWGRHALAAGLTWHLYGAALDLAYAHHFVASQNVTDSQVVQQVSPELKGSGLPASEASVVGNGRYEAAMDLVSLSIRLPFGGLRSAY